MHCMKTINRLIPLLIAVFPLTAVAQSSTDALRYSQTSHAGTARFTSMSGAFGALGGDFSVLSWNPAGIAIYRKSEFTFSPSFYVGKTASEYLAQSSKENKYNFNFGNIGIILTRKLTNNDTSIGWKNWNFGIGYNRLNNYHTKSFYRGINPDNSLLDRFLDNLNTSAGTDPENLNPFDENLAYQTYLINPDSTNHYSSVIPNGGSLQRRTSATKGAMSEIDFSFGANYSNKLYFGGTIGFNAVRYIEETTYEEVDPDTSIYDFKSFSFNQYLATHGYGINLKLGMIYRAQDWVRIGFAFHTPTFYSMEDDYHNTMNSRFDNGDSYSFDSPLGNYNYELTTPMRAIGSIAFIIGKLGLVSADYEFVDYSEARLEAIDYGFFNENNDIQNKYAAANNLKLGTEWRHENYSFRAGFATFGSPFATGYKVSGADMSKKSYSIGLGIRDKDYFIDFGYVFTNGSDYYQPYALTNEDVPGVKNKIQSHNITFTLGAKF